MSGCAAPIACTLAPGAFKNRAGWMHEIATKALIGHRREDLALHLTYASSFATEVRELVERETECCGFLTFALSEDHGAVHLTLTGSADARDSLDTVFALYLP
ncbi:MAG: hypothetical protein J0H82_26925 [Alphaproteobacteria bacterium]|jgi:hypothetical protein|nr:hypothetical protein [Alphaproteobacteria bacterium]